ncbi:hypothetical protein SDJN03_17259, partial [Cucurbita argyrosperma subsp. sororia]
MMNSEEAPCHVFLVCYPSQGHINPTLRLAKKLAAEGLLVTISTAVHFGKTLQKAGSIGAGDCPTPVGNGFIRFEFFEDGLQEINPKDMNLTRYNNQLELSGRPSLTGLIKNQTAENRPVSCLILNPFFPWTCEVAKELEIPCAVLWVQSCAVFSIYYHCFHESFPFPSELEPKIDVHLPILPLLKNDEIPSFLHPNNIYGVLGNVLLSQFSKLSIPFCILMDTFNELEKDIINYMSNIIPLKPIGPLFLNPQNVETEWGDQVTNAKFLVEDYGVGVRLSRGAEANELISRDEIVRCISEVMTRDSSGGEFRRNALKLKQAAAAAVVDGGASHQNIQEFVDEIKKRCVRGNF